MVDLKREVHNIPPLYDKNSQILVLGSFPSVKSRETEFFYSHKQNRFWKVMANIFGSPVPASVDEKKKLLLENHIALWDVIASCEISGSSDNSIKDVVPNDITVITDSAKIKAVLLNGKTAYKYFDKYLKNSVEVKAICMSSTSPANASKSFEALCTEWNSVIKSIISDQ